VRMGWVGVVPMDSSWWLGRVRDRMTNHADIIDVSDSGVGDLLMDG